MSERKGVDPGLLLFVTPVLWGVTFPAAKLALDHLPTLPFTAWTRGLGFLSILVTVPLLRKAADGPDRRPREAVAPGLLLGALIFVAYLLQTEGLARTTATNAGFITGLYVVFTPILAAAVLRTPIPGAAWLAVAISVAGTALLSVRELDAVRLYPGDLLVLAGALAWAAHIVAIARLSPRFPAWLLSLAQMGATFAFHLLATVPAGIQVSTALSPPVLGLLFLTGVLGSGVAYTLQVMAQQTISAARAVVVLAGESVFAALFAAVWIDERLSAHQWAGALMVLAAMAYSELAARRPPVARLEPASAP